MDLKNKKVLVIGLGKSGEATALFLQKKGAPVRLTEAADSPALQDRKKKLEKLGINVELGGHTRGFLDEIDLVVPSPGAAPDILPLQFAVEHKIPVWSEIELAYRFCPAPIIAVTGTNGKSTVVSLLADTLKADGRKTILAGNIGTPFISVVDDLTPDSTVVLEVSSFQLEWIVRFRPAISVLLNITADHLDRYPDFAAYFKAKKRIFENQTPADIALVNYDDPESRRAVADCGGRKFFYSRFPAPKEADAAVFFRTDGRSVFLPSGEKLLDVPPGKLWGVHNQENILAACAAAYFRGTGIAAMSAAITGFQPLAHRVELVAEKSGVRYFDDSKATNVDSTLRALQSFPENRKHIILILGGKDKGGSYQPLRPEVEKKVKALILLGEAAERIAAELAGGAPVKRVSSLPEGVREAQLTAAAGDAVLLSPACSSFDMFASYAERGDIFKKSVAALS